MEPIDPQYPIDPNEPQHIPFADLVRDNAEDDDGEEYGDDGSYDGSDDAADARPNRAWWYLAATAVIVVVGMTLGIIVFNSAAPDPGRGTKTPQEAAAHFVAALNAGDEDSAAGISCDTFLKAARAEARSGEQGIRYKVLSVRMSADDTAAAAIQASLEVGGAKQTDTLRVSVFKTDGLWLMCGQD